eukprot:jgi/Tetstr1/463664/TSEL_008525.t1
MGRHNSKRRMPEGKEGWTPATGTWEAAIKRVRCGACGALVSRTRFYDTHRWTEACAEPPDTATPVAAGGDGAPAAPYVRHASAPSGPGQTETRGELASMAAQETNAELHVGTVITKTFGTRGSFLGQELRELMDADSNADSDAEGIVAGVVDDNPSDDSRGDSDGEGDAGARYDFVTGTNIARGKYDDEKRRRQLYTSADATLMEAALNICEWKLKRNIKMAAFERLSKLLEKHVLPKDGSEHTETWYQMEQCLDVPDIKKYIVHCCPCDEHRYGHSLDGDRSYDDRCPRCNLTRWTPASLRHPRPATPQPRKFYYDYNVCKYYFGVCRPDAPYFNGFTDGMHMVVMDAAQGKTADDDYEPSIAYCGDAHLQLSSADMRYLAKEAGAGRIVPTIAGTSGLSPFVRWLLYISYVDFWPLPIAHALLLGVVKDFWEYVGTLKDMRPKMKKMDRRMALVTRTSDFGRPVRPMLPSAGTSGVVCANWTCEDFLHFAETVAVLWEAAGADDAVDKFEGTGPGCWGAAVQTGTSGAPATWTDCESKALLRPNLRKGHDAFPVALKHIEEKLCCFYADPADIVTDQHLSKFGMFSHDVGLYVCTGCIVEDVRQALFRGQATNNHIRVHP